MSLAILLFELSRSTVFSTSVLLARISKNQNPQNQERIPLWTEFSQLFIRRDNLCSQKSIIPFRPFSHYSEEGTRQFFLVNGGEKIFCSLYFFHHEGSHLKLPLPHSLVTFCRWAAFLYCRWQCQTLLLPSSHNVSFSKLTVSTKWFRTAIDKTFTMVKSYLNHFTLPDYRQVIRKRVEQ